MSLFSDILSSIGGEAVPKPPQPPVKRPASTNANRPGDDLSKPVAGMGINGGFATTNGVKRKLQDELSKEQGIEKPAAGSSTATKPAPYAGTMTKAKSSPATSVPRPRHADGPPITKASSATPPTSASISAATVKAPAKGSYAEIIARAKAAQQERGGQQVGVIKHQKEQREKVSYLAQRQSRNEDIKTKVDKLKTKPGPTGPVLNGRIDKRARSSSPLKRPGSASKMTEKVARERAARPVYSGTMRTPSSSKRHDKPKPARRQDEYLGTDEEDNSDLADEIDEADNDGSDDSSDDMEAGIHDIDEEEAAAVRVAKLEDARELAKEKRLKAEKEARKQRLEALSRKAPGKRY